jgi:hypothetical protein
MDKVTTVGNCDAEYSVKSINLGEKNFWLKLLQILSAKQVDPLSSYNL